MLNQSLVQQIKEKAWHKNPRLYFQDCLQIADKVSGRRIPLELNSHQKTIQREVDRQRALGIPVRIIILKPRQTGISTVCCANIFHAVRFGGGFGMTVSKDLDSSEHLHTIDQRFYHYLPDSEKDVIQQVASNRKELKFDEPHGGHIMVETAGKTGAGHSFTIRHLHLSEVPRWPDGCDDTVIGLLNAVPRSPDTTIIIEGVANGMQGWFHEEWNRNDSDYVKVFLPWFEHSEYSKALPQDEAIYAQGLSDDERKLMARFRLRLEQIEWRRWCTRNNCKDNPDMFREQYPATPEEAFVSSGNAFFHTPTLERMETSEPFRCDLRVSERTGGQREVVVVANPRGHLRLWKKPKDSSDYVLGADVAEGIEIEGAPSGDKHDYSCACVLDRATGELAAQLHGKITPDEFGRQIALLGEYYRFAFLGIERNGGYGQHVIAEIRNSKPVYPDQFIYRNTVTDEATRRTTDKLGWATTTANRKSLVSALDMALRKDELVCYCAETKRELYGFVTLPSGRVEGGNGVKDDRVFALAIAYQMLEAAPAMLLRPAETEINKGVLPIAPARSIYSFVHRRQQRQQERFGLRFRRMA